MSSDDKLGRQFALPYNIFSECSKLNLLINGAIFTVMIYINSGVIYINSDDMIIMMLILIII